MNVRPTTSSSTEGVRESYRTRDMRSLLGNMGLGHVRYATVAVKPKESGPSRQRPLRHRAGAQRQPDQHPGCAEELFTVDRAPPEFESDTEILLNTANALQANLSGTA